MTEKNKIYRKKNEERIKQAAKVYYHKQDREVRNSHSRRYTSRRREEFLTLYGGKCACCGESEKIFLTIDHVFGQVGKKKEPTHTALNRAIRNPQSGEYRILCMNCNSAVRFGRTCPHQNK